MSLFEIPRIGVATIVLRDGHLLMGKRKGRGANHWEFPGGHLEFGETILECAARELLEETGLEAISLKMIEWVENPAETGDRHYVTFFVLAEGVLGEPITVEPEKSEGWEWFPIDNLPSPLFATVPRLLEKFDLQCLL